VTERNTGADLGKAKGGGRNPEGYVSAPIEKNLSIACLARGGVGNSDPEKEK